MAEGRALTVRAEFCCGLCLQPEPEVVLEEVDFGLRVRSVQQAIEGIHPLVRRYVASDACLAVELVSARREASALG
jgi:hypothetical protein